jgi:hypothetical protein
MRDGATGARAFLKGFPMSALPSLSTRAMLASVTVRQWTARKFDKRVSEAVNASHGAAMDAGRYNKRLIASDALASIQRITGEARQAHYHFTLPWADTGARLLPASTYLPFAARMRALRNDFEAAVSAFVAGYPDYIAEARTRLNGMFDPADYPDAADVGARFGFEVAISPVPAAGDFRVALSEDQAEAIRADIERRAHDATQAAIRAAYERVSETVGHMARKLAEYRPATATEKAQGIFRDSLVENVRELAGILPHLNVTGDPDLAALADRIASSLTTHDAETLRESDATRARIASEAQAIADHVGAFLA